MMWQKSARQTIWDNEKKTWKSERARRDAIPQGESVCFDEAYERGMRLLNLDLTQLDVNMFAAVSNSLINDGAGYTRGRLYFTV